MRRLSSEVVRFVRRRLAAGDTAVFLAAKLGVSDTAIRKIGRGVSHSDVGGPRTKLGHRGQRGDTNVRSKLSLAKCIEATRRVKAGEPVRLVAESMGVVRRTIKNLLTGRTWNAGTGLRPLGAGETPWFFALDLRKQRPVSDTAGEDDLVQAVFDYYRRAGFPYPAVSPTLVASGVASLMQDSTAVDADGLVLPSGTGVRVPTAFHPRFFHVRRRGYLSLIEAFESDDQLKDAIRRHLRFGRHLTPPGLRYALGNGCHARQLAGFQPSAAKAVYDYFGARRTLDLSAGWGGRMFAAAVLGVSYVGIDPCKATIEGNEKLRSATARTLQRQPDSHLVVACAEDVVGRGLWRPDLIFTSPPYFDLEQYSDEPTQSFRRYPSLSVWLDGFMRRCIEGCARDLVIGGFLALNVAKQLAPFVRRFALAAGLREMRHLSLAFPRRQVEMRRGRTRTEPILIFRRGT